MPVIVTLAVITSIVRPHATLTNTNPENNLRRMPKSIGNIAVKRTTAGETIEELRELGQQDMIYQSVYPPDMYRRLLRECGDSVSTDMAELKRDKDLSEDDEADYENYADNFWDEYLHTDEINTKTLSDEDFAASSSASG